MACDMFPERSSSVTIDREDTNVGNYDSNKLSLIQPILCLNWGKYNNYIKKEIRKVFAYIEEIHSKKFAETKIVTYLKHSSHV